MKLPQTNADESQPKTLATRIAGSMPIVLTVLATILAGLSSSEMTRSQYYRSLAAQNQSKAGDQWNFFQAKRIRGTNLEVAIELLRAESGAGKFDAETLQATSDELLAGLHRTELEAKRLVQAAGLASAGSALAQAATKLQQQSAVEVKQAEAAAQRIKQMLGQEETRTALAYLKAGALPAVSTRPLEPALFREAFDAIAARRTERETGPLMARLSEEDLLQAIELAETNVQTVEDVDKPISTALGQIDILVQEEAGVARSLGRSVRAVTAAAADMPAGDAKSQEAVRSLAAALGRSGEGLKTTSAELRNDFRSAVYGYSVRRYKREADFNRQAALAYEVQVRNSGFSSERHRGRSVHFFIGMLIAQAGVTISTFAMAVKHKSLFWSLAGVAGLSAIVLGLYVYLRM